MKAPNGKPTNLTERQWLQVRTKAFKDWFGDWEKNSKKNFLLKSSPVATLNGNEFSRVEGKSLTDQVEEYFKSIGNVAVSPFIGEVILDRDGADDSLAHGMGRLKAIAYAGVKDVIEKGVVVDTNENHRERGYNTMVVAAPISIGGNRHICTVVIKRNLTDNKFYLHEVTLQEKLLNEGSNTAQKQPQRPTAIANILKDIIVSSDNVSKVVDENGEPTLDQIKSATDNIGTFSGESDDIRYRKVRKVFNSDLSRGEVRAIQKYIESLDENTDTSNGLYFKKGNYLYKFNTSLRQYADNRKDGHDGFEVLEKYDISNLNKEQLKSIEDGIRNGKNIDSMLDKQGPWNEEGGLYDSDVIVDNRETAGNNDRLDNKTLQGETNRGRGDRSGRENKGEDYGVVTERSLEPEESEEQRHVRRIRQWQRDKLMFGNLSQEQKDYLKEIGISVEEYNDMSPFEREVLFRCMWRL